MDLTRFRELADFSGRAALVAAFGVIATGKLMRISASLRQKDVAWLELATQVASLAFVLLVIWMAIIRLKPLRSTDGWEPRLSALIGSFLPMALVALPPADLQPGVQVLGLVMIFAGWVLSVYVLVWLGRSFSVTPQARRLITEGPYRLVRHPLYLAEEVAIIGVMLLHLSSAAVGIAILHWMFQLRRMVNEEKVLAATFPEYAAYRASTPRVLPLTVSKSARQES